MFVLYHPKTKQISTYTATANPKTMTVGSYEEPMPIATAREMYRTEIGMGFVRVDDKLHVTTQRSRSSVNATLVGTPEAVEAYKTRLFAHFHPCGYGTTVRIVREIGPNVVVASTYHATSCD